MAKGDGCIRKLGPNLWEVRIPNGKDPMTGRYRTKTQRVHGTKSQARKVRDELIRQRDNGIDLDAGKMTFGEFASEWVRHHVETEGLRENTAHYYRHLLNRTVRAFGQTPLKDVTPMMLAGFYDDMRHEGLSGSTVNALHKFIKSVFKQAVDYDIVLRNPADRVKPPKNEHAERRSLTDVETAALLAHVDESERAAYEALEVKESRQREDGLYERGYIRGVRDISGCVAVRIAVATGMRRGEVLALTWDDIDLERRTIRVRHNLTSSGRIGDPKSNAGIRTVSIDGKTAQTLSSWKENQAAIFSASGVTTDGSSPVCCDSAGGYLNTNNFSTWWRRFASECGFNGLRMHELRHTHATLLHDCGTDVKTLQTRLGHADISTTLGMYVHPVRESDEEAAERFAERLENPKSGKVLRFPRAV